MNDIITENITKRDNLEKAFSEVKKIILSGNNPEEISKIEYLSEKIKTNTVNFAVIGQFKRGKSSFINALLGKDILPSAVIPVTSVITIIEYSDFIKSKVYFLDDNSIDIKINKLNSMIG